MIHTERKRGPHNSGADGQAIEVARGQSTHKCRREVMKDGGLCRREAESV
jgi:hypothetical protein